MNTRTRSRSINFHLLTAALVSALFILSSCGGGGGGSSSVGGGDTGTPPPTSGSGGDTGNGGDTSTTFSGGISGSGTIHSRIQGFGSVIVNDDEYDTSSAVFIVDGDESATQEDLHIGQIISIETDFDNLVATKIEYRAAIEAPIDTIVITDILNGEATITSLGQTLLTNASTNFEIADLSQFLVGDLIDASGFLDENQNIIVTFIEKKNVLAEYMVVGTITNLTSTTFNIGMLMVDYSTASLSDFDGAMPTEGQLVEVNGLPANYTAPDQLLASAIELIPATSAASDDRLEIEGIISRFVSAEDFDIANAPVTTSDTETVYVNGSKDLLALGVSLEAEGGVNQNGVLEAVEITFKPSNAVRVDAVIESVDLTANTLTALGLVFTIRDSTQFEDESPANLQELELADLSPGDYIELRAFQDGAALVASKIERDEFDDESELRGPVTTIDTALGTLEILGILITTDENTNFKSEDEDDDGNSGAELTQSEFFETLKIGDILEAEWKPFVSTDTAATSLEIEDE